jgi:site-specific DNA-methyltransferase (adenine-specific)
VAEAVTPYYDDGTCRLYLGNCVDILSEFPPCFRVDHVITDPPYARDVYVRMSQPNTNEGSETFKRLSVPAVGKQGRPIHDLKSGALARMAAGDIGAIDETLEPVAEHCARLAKRWVVVFSDAETTWRWRAALEQHGLRYVRTGAWVKPDAMPQMTGDRPSVGFEPCTIAHAQGPMRWNGGGKPAVWTHFTAKGHARPDHPCPKPEPLMLELVEQFTDPGDVILDPFAGSGTTLYAAKRLGRRAIGCEVNERFAEIAAKRLAQGALDLFGEQSA